MRRASGGLAAGALAAGLWLAAAGPSFAGEVTEVGWWTRRPGAGAQPDGGFEVAAAIDGPSSIAAIRVVSEPVATATLTLEESDGVAQATAALRVCTTALPWEAANPGAWDARPDPDCTRSAPLERNDDGTWTADVAALLGEEQSSLTVVPAEMEDAPVPVTPGFQVSFAGASLETTPAVTTSPSPGFSGGGDFDFGSGSGDGDEAAPQPGTSAPPAAFDFGGVGDTELPPVDDQLPAAEEPLEEDAVAEEPPAQPQLATGPVSSGPDRSRPWHRLLVLVPVSAVAGAATVAARRYPLDRILRRA